MIEVRRCRGKDIKAMRGKLRYEDFLELKRRSGDDPYKVLVHSYRSSEVAYTGLVDGEIACVFGVAQSSLIGSQAQIWLLSTEVMMKAPVAVARKTRNELTRLLVVYDYLDNYVDASYARCIRWLKWLGFTVEAPQRLGVNGAEFCHFYIGAELGDQKQKCCSGRKGFEYV